MDENNDFSTVSHDGVSSESALLSNVVSDETIVSKEITMSSDAMDSHLRGVIEALMFVNERPITLEQFKRVLKTAKLTDIKNIISRMQKDWADRGSGIQIVEIAGGYQLLTNRNYAAYIRDFYKTRHSEKLSKPALETLAIVAYKQPVTRADVELIRGVNSDGVVNHLLSKELIKIVGRKDVAGKPYLYGTTRQFLEYFGLSSLGNLPKLEEFPQLQPDYENTALDEEYLSGDEPTIPQEALVMNSLEKSKQSAIHRLRPAQSKHNKTSNSEEHRENTTET
jgi:segregation and condensation protein B